MIIDIKKLFILAVFVFSGCATAPAIDIESLDTSGIDPAYVVMKLGVQSRYIHSLTFRHVGKETPDYNFILDRREGESIVLSLPPGEYYLVRLKTHFLDKQGVQFKKPKQFINLSAGRLHYLGDLRWKDESVFVDFDKSSVLQAVSENKELLESAELIVYNHLFGDASIASVTPRNTSKSAADSLPEMSCGVSQGRGNPC